MKGKTHVAGGAAAACVAAYYIPNSEPVFMVAAGALGGIVPDICHGGSKIGRRFRLLSFIVNFLFGHRTFTHSLLFLGILSALALYFVPSGYMDLVTAFLAGIVSHLILDAATSNGIGLFYPLKKKIRFPLTTRTGGIGEWIVFAGISIFLAYAGFEYIGQL